MPQNSTWSNLLDPFPIARGAAVNTFTTFRDVSPTPLVASMAGQLVVGTKVNLEAWGEYTCTTGITIQLGFIYNATAGAAGGTTLAASGVITTGTTPTAWPWHLKWAGIVTAIGSSGVIYGQGILDLGTSLTAWASSPLPVTAAARSVTIDTTVPRPLWGVGCAMGTSGSNGPTVDVFNVEIVNQGKTS